MKIKKIAQTPGLVATVVDNLNSTSTTDALSANQGKKLNENKLDTTKLYTGDVNNLVGTGFYYCDSGCKNTPLGVNGYIFIQHIPGNNNYCYHRFIAYNTGTTYERVKNAGVWGEWVELGGIKEILIENILVNGWTGNGISNIFKDRNIVHFNISIRYGTDVLTMTLPKEFRPLGNIIVPIVTTGGKSSYIIVSSTGEITCTSEMLGQAFMANCTWLTNE